MHLHPLRPPLRTTTPIAPPPWLQLWHALLLCLSLRPNPFSPTRCRSVTAPPPLAASCVAPSVGWLCLRPSRCCAHFSSPWTAISALPPPLFPELSLPLPQTAVHYPCGHCSTPTVLHVGLWYPFLPAHSFLVLTTLQGYPFPGCTFSPSVNLFGSSSCFINMSNFSANIKPLFKAVKYSSRQLDVASDKKCSFVCCARFESGKLALLHATEFVQGSPSIDPRVARSMKQLFESLTSIAGMMPAISEELRLCSPEANGAQSLAGLARPASTTSTATMERGA